jgi:hypothetical protein
MVIMNLGEYKPMNMHTESISGACLNLECLKRIREKRGGEYGSELEFL